MSSNPLPLQHRASGILDQPLCPDTLHVQRTLRKSSHYWNGLMSAVDQKHTFSFPEYDWSWIRERVPPFPQCNEGESVEVFSSHSSWKVLGPEECEVTGRTYDIRGPTMSKVTTNAVPVTLEDGMNHGVQGDTDNILSIMTLAWCYILSVRWLEIQAIPSHNVSYTESRTPSVGEASATSAFCFPNLWTQSRRTRWLSAILAPGHGYQAKVAESATHSFYAPWMISLEGTPFTLPKCIENDSDEEDRPLSSTEALDALKDICALHKVDSFQVEVSMAIAISVPMHRVRSIPLTLPRPRIHWTPFSHTQKSSHTFDMFSESVPHLMTFSISYDVSNSTLCGIFWESGIPSNLVSAWFQPSQELWRSTSMNAKTRGIICARRAPSMGIFYLAASISGSLTHIFDQAQSGVPPLEPHARSWTGLTQSFMEMPACAGDPDAFLKRSDCWRLRRLPASFDDDLHYEGWPFSPWEPPGFCASKFCPLRVQMHLKCSEHASLCSSFEWHLDSGRRVTFALSNAETPLPSGQLYEDGQEFTSEEVHHSKDHDSSKEATTKSFRWVLDNNEGNPPEAAYRDPWLAFFTASPYSDNSDNSDNSDDSDNSDNLNKPDSGHSSGAPAAMYKRPNVQAWLDDIPSS